MARGASSLILEGLPLLLLTLVLVTGCSAFDGRDVPEPEPTSSGSRNTVDAAPIGTKLAVTASVASVITPTSFVVEDADLPGVGLLVLTTAAPVLHPFDLVSIDGDIVAFSFAGFARRYGLTDVAPLATFEGMKVLVAREVRSWAEPSDTEGRTAVTQPS